MFAIAGSLRLLRCFEYRETFGTIVYSQIAFPLIPHISIETISISSLGKVYFEQYVSYITEILCSRLIHTVTLPLTVITVPPWIQL